MKITFDKIERDAEIVVAKTVVLFRIEHFQQRRRRIAAKIRADLVDLVEHDQRIVCAGLLNRLNDAAGHRADVSSAVAANLSFIVNAAQRQAHKLSIERARDRTTQRSLANSRRANQTKNRAFRFFLQLANSQRFDDSILNLLESVVIFVENLLGLFQIEIVNRRL